MEFQGSTKNTDENRYGVWDQNKPSQLTPPTLTITLTIVLYPHTQVVLIQKILLKIGFLTKIVVFRRIFSPKIWNSLDGDN
jgi:hypothetical protein